MSAAPREKALRAALAADPGGVLERIAEGAGATLGEALVALGPDQALRLPPERFDDVWAELTTWGALMLIVHTRDGVFEVRSPLSPGSHGRGYFNHHGAGPLSGHLRAERVAAIHLVDRPFMGRRSLSAVFVSRDGEAMLKAFVARDASRALRPEGVARFEALRAREAVRA